ncbi:MAG: hypothetical protein ACRECX_12425 [Methyloceanibacter sp.]
MPIQGVGTTPFFNVTANGVVNSTAAGSQNAPFADLRDRLGSRKIHP